MRLLLILRSQSRSPELHRSVLSDDQSSTTSVRPKQSGPALCRTLGKRNNKAGFRSHQLHYLPGVVRCSISSSSNGNGSMAGNFNENDADYVNSSVLEAEVKSGDEGFAIKMRDGTHLRCVQNKPQGREVPDYAPHPAIVLKMEDGTGLLLPIIVLEMPSVLLMAAVCNVQIARPTLYHVIIEMIDRMGYAVPIQVNKSLAYSDGMRVIDPVKLAPLRASDGLFFSELDRPSGQPCIDTKEFNILSNMFAAANEERFTDAAEWGDKLKQFRSKKKST